MGFCNPVRIHGMRINDVIYDMIGYGDMVWYAMIRNVASQYFLKNDMLP
jgi:hypothetical protein